MHAHIAEHAPDEATRARARLSLAVSRAQRAERARTTPAQPMSPWLRALIRAFLQWLQEVGDGPTPAPTTAPPVPPAPPHTTPMVDRTILNGEHDKLAYDDTVMRSEGDPASGDAMCDGAYTGLGHVWDFYWRLFGRDSLDGQGLPLDGVVHYAQGYDNAFYSSATNEMSFGDGDGRVFRVEGFTSAADIDVPAHELTHGVTAHTAGLAYTDQAGGLNESVSDVFGICVKYWLHGTAAADADWLIGASILADGVHGRGLRDMLHPGTAYDDPVLGRDPQYGDMASYSDGDDPHITSGIPNRAFALAAVAAGGRPWETVLPAWYAALTSGQLSPQATFEEFAAATVAQGGKYASFIKEAWYKVGVPVQRAVVPA